MQLKTLKHLFNFNRESSLFGRYITVDSLEASFKKMRSRIQIEAIGKSVNQLPIHSITFGTGTRKILMWSQMHGNESTTTKALFDLLNTIEYECEWSDLVLENCTVKIIPILNPDGAKAYTRSNANGVDLNRDAKALSQPESRILKTVFDGFQPDYCFNLHGQRTIFSAGKAPKVATVSFLAPAQDHERSLTKNRKAAMELIAVMNHSLQQNLEGHIGIYDDTFNPNCVGDTFQALGVPTVLFEAGHYPNDYEREQTREYIFQALLVALERISQKPIDGTLYEPYLSIPENQKRFYDVIIRNTEVGDVAIQFEEKLVDGKIDFCPKIEKISDLKNFYGHREIEANGHRVFDAHMAILKEGIENDFVFINNEKFSLKP